MDLEWHGVDEMLKALDDYERRVLKAVEEVAKYFAPVIEGYAKDEAPWTDRTGNARQSLFTAVEVAEDVVNLYLSHHVEYGFWLEFAMAGKYAIIWPTLEAHFDEIMDALNGIFA